MSITRPLEAELAALERLVAAYCREHHGPHGAGACPDCCDLLEYAQVRLSKCPHNPKPMCKDCSIHCYKGDYREQILAVMRFAAQRRNT